MGLNATNLQQLIITTLSQADDSALETLQSQVPLYWTLYGRKAHFPELQYWYVRREAIRLLMGCANKQVDYLRRTQNASRVTADSGGQDTLMLATSNDNSLSEANRSSHSEFNSESDSLGTSSSSSSRASSQGSLADSLFSDTGSGTNSQSRLAHQRTDQKEESDVEERTQANGRMNRVRDPSDNSGFHSLGTYQDISWEAFDPATVGVPLGFAIGILEKTTTESGSEVNQQSTEDVYATVPNSESDTPTNTTTTNTIVRTVPLRSTLMASYDVPAKADGTPDLTPASVDPNSATSRKSSQSLFTANVDSSDTNSSLNSSDASSVTESQSNATGTGSGFSVGSGVSTSEATALATRTASGSGLSTRSNQSTSQMDSLMERLNQRFKHLQTLWENCNEMIRWLEAQHLVLTPYVIAQITIQYPDGWDAEIANRYLVKQPCVSW